MNASEVLKKYQITVDSEFVPWSQSRNKGEKYPSLNWKVTLKVKDREILTTDYMAGCGHCPSYDRRTYKTIYGHDAIMLECEKGVHAHQGGAYVRQTTKKITPNPADVVYSLLLDSDVLGCNSFEEWAAELGFDEDSRKAEKMYNECLKIAIPFRNAFTSEELEELQEAFQDY